MGDLPLTNLRIAVIERSLAWHQFYQDLTHSMGLSLEVYETTTALAASPPSHDTACLIADTIWHICPSNGNQICLMQHLESIGHTMPVIFHCNNEEVTEVVRAMEAGAITFRNKPSTFPSGLPKEILDSCRTALSDYIRHAIEMHHQLAELRKQHDRIEETLSSLSPRQRDVLDHVVAGEPTKSIAKHLHVSQRLVEKERSHILRQFNVESTPNVCTQIGIYRALSRVTPWRRSRP